MIPALLHRCPRLALGGLALVIATVIAACGGAIGSGGTGAAPPAVSGGTVTGFGSVIIDGLRFDDRTIATVTEASPGVEVLAEARMGQRVEAELDSDGKPKTLRVAASVTGSVTDINVTSAQVGRFVVLGQTIIVNGDSGAGPVTQFGGGYGNALDIRIGDAVEVHGATKEVGSSTALQTTRVEKLSVAPAYLLVSGVVSGLGVGGAGKFSLESLTIDLGAAMVTPAGATVADGMSVVVFAPPSNLTMSPAGVLVLTASALRIKTYSNASIETYASGFISQLDTVLGQFKLDGLLVKYTPSGVSPAGTALVNGQYVQARGSFGTDGALIAAQVKLRDGKNEPEAELKGTIVGFDVTSGTFRIRDVNVTLGTGKLEGCPITGLRDGLFVELEGSLGPTGVVAKKVECKSEPDSAVIERKGVASAVDPASSSFILTPSGKPPVKVYWSATTFFRAVTVQSLSGTTVEVEGTLVNGDIQATKIKFDD